MSNNVAFKSKRASVRAYVRSGLRHEPGYSGSALSAYLAQYRCICTLSYMPGLSNALHVQHNASSVRFILAWLAKVDVTEDGKCMVNSEGRLQKNWVAATNSFPVTSADTRDWYGRWHDSETTRVLSAMLERGQGIFEAEMCWKWYIWKEGTGLLGTALAMGWYDLAD
jgi:hypothetical protein